MDIRAATPGDCAEIIEMGERMHREGAYRFLPFDRDKVRLRLEEYLEHPGRHCLFVAEHRGALIGMLGGYLDDYVFCDELVAYDTVVFVEGRHRGSAAALRLVRAFRGWAIARGAREICLGISSGVNTDRVGKFYERLGLARVGAIYKQRLR